MTAVLVSGGSRDAYAARRTTSQFQTNSYLPQVVSWRYSPRAKGKPPFCTCTYCTRGEYGAARMRRGQD